MDATAGLAPQYRHGGGFNSGSSAINTGPIYCMGTFKLT